MLLIYYLVLFKLITAEKQMSEIFGWKTVDYRYPNDEARLEAIAEKKFIPQNNIPFGIEVWNDKLFITVPRRGPGIPSTLNYVSLAESNGTSPPLVPYPNWQSNDVDDGSIISVFRINVDVCNRLWLVDTGSIMDFDGKGIRVGPPNIQIFNLKTNKLERKHVIDGEKLRCDSTSFTNIVADVIVAGNVKCGEAFAYAVNPGSNTMLVYSYKEDRSWLVKHPYFNIDPLSTNYRVADLNFQWDDGIFGIALSSAAGTLFFHPMSSTLEFAVDTKRLKNISIASNYENFRIVGSRGSAGQSSPSAFDETDGVLFYSLINKNAIGCWNSRKYPRNYSTETSEIVFADSVKMIYVSDLKIDKRQNELWAISNRLPISLYSNMNFEEVNFRIFKRSVKNLINGTRCANVRAFWSRAAGQRR